MNIRIPTSEAIKRVEKRIKEIKIANEKNKKIKTQNEEAQRAFKERAIALALEGNCEVDMSWSYPNRHAVIFTLPASFKKPTLIQYVDTPKGDLAELERVLGLLKISTSQDVSLKAIKGLAEML